MVVSVFRKKVRLPRGEEKLKIEYIGEIGKRLILKSRFENERQRFRGCDYCPFQ